MKTIILTLAIFITSCGCPSQKTGKKKTFTVYSFEQPGQQWTASSVGKLECDSATMISPKTADAWVNGSKVHIIAKNRIIIETN